MNLSKEEIDRLEKAANDCAKFIVDTDKYLFISTSLQTLVMEAVQIGYNHAMKHCHVRDPHGGDGVHYYDTNYSITDPAIMTEGDGNE